MYKLHVIRHFGLFFLVNITIFIIILELSKNVQFFFLQIYCTNSYIWMSTPKMYGTLECVLCGGEKRIQLHISSLKKKKQIELLSKIGLNVHYLPKSQHCLCTQCAVI